MANKLAKEIDVSGSSAGTQLSLLRPSPGRQAEARPVEFAY
jgi:hypothetical protein